jgi:hypothetical protein
MGTRQGFVHLATFSAGPHLRIGSIGPYRRGSAGAAIAVTSPTGEAERIGTPDMLFVAPRRPRHWIKRTVVFRTNGT